MASTVWSGHLSFGLISIPVRLSVAARPQSVSFNMLHRTDNSRLKQQYTCQSCNQIVDRDETVKGFEYAKDQYIVIEPSEIQQIQPETNRTMEILEFIPIDQIDPIYFDSSYYLTPELAGQKAYSLVAKAMENKKFVAIAKLFMHNREYTVFIRHFEGGLVLHTMFYSTEVRQPETQKFSTEEPTPGELKMAGQFLEALVGDWEPDKYSDSFQKELQDLITMKIQGQVAPKKEKKKRSTPIPDIQEAIRQSLKAIEEKKLKASKK